MDTMRVTFNLNYTQYLETCVAINEELAENPLNLCTLPITFKKYKH